MIIENLTTLKINKLTKAQYEAALAAGAVNENELYMTEIEGDAIEEIQLNGTPISPTSGVVNIDITEYVAENGGKIDSISVNGVTQTIDEKSVNLDVPTNSEFNTHVNNKTLHFTADEKTKLAGIEANANNYTHPSSHAATMITEDSTHRFVKDTDKATWNTKYDKPSSGIPKTDLASAVQTSLEKADTALQAHQDISGKLDKLTYEWNKQLSCGSNGLVCLGKFPCYDTNVTIDIDSTTSTTYHGTLVIATQNINTTGGGTLTANVYGDASGTLASSIKIEYASGSNVVSVYAALAGWSKNLIHVRAVSLQGNATDILTSVSSIPTSANRVPTNVITSKYATKEQMNTAINDAKTQIVVDATSGAKTLTLSTTNTNTEWRYVYASGISSLILNKSGTLTNADLAYYTMVFVSGTTATTITDNIGINFIGDDCATGVFTPYVSTTYELSVWWNGISWQGIVKEV